MKEPLNQFADRLIANGEVEEFIHGLIDKGVSLSDIRGFMPDRQGCVFMQAHEEKPKLLTQEMYDGMALPVNSVRLRRYSKRFKSKLP